MRLNTLHRTYFDHHCRLHGLHLPQNAMPITAASQNAVLVPRTLCPRPCPCDEAPNQERERDRHVSVGRDPAYPHCLSLSRSGHSCAWNRWFELLRVVIDVGLRMLLRVEGAPLTWLNWDAAGRECVLCVVGVGWVFRGRVLPREIWGYTLLTVLRSFVYPR